jgi:hypothetical protein
VSISVSVIAAVVVGENRNLRSIYLFMYLKLSRYILCTQPERLINVKKLRRRDMDYIL